MLVRTGLFCGIGLLASLTVRAQHEPVALKIGDRAVTQTELSAAYKGYIAPEKDKRKTVDAFVQQFVDMQRRAMAARAAKMDTAAAFRRTLTMKKAALIRPLYLTPQELDSAALKVYTATKEETGGRPLLNVAAIFRYLPQNASPALQRREQQVADSLYNVLLKGGDFLALAAKYSSPEDVAVGCVPRWLETGRTWSDLEAQAYALQPGQISRPFLSVRGFYILKLFERQPFPAFEAVKPRLLNYMDANGVTLRLVREKFRKELKTTQPAVDSRQLQQQIESALLEKHPEVRRRLKGYEDALLSAEWMKLHPDSDRELALKYPAEIHEKVVRALEENKK